MGIAEVAGHKRDAAAAADTLIAQMQLIDPERKAALLADLIKPARLQSSPRILLEADKGRSERCLRRRNVMGAKKTVAGVRRVGDAADAPREQIAAIGYAAHSQGDIGLVTRQAQALPRAQNLHIGLAGSA